jgi:hypothetical protein
VLIKSEHIKATVQMSREFKDYLLHIHKQDLKKRAARMGHRFDAYGSGSGSGSGTTGSGLGLGPVLGEKTRDLTTKY